MIILFGSSGYIGSEFKRQLTDLNLKFYCWPSTANTSLFDLNKWYKETGNPKIDIAINCAAYIGKPNVEVCEYNKESTILGNIIWANTITTWCKLNEITLGHISSGCIYSGCNPNGDPFNEEDEPNLTFVQNNCSFYGGTKALSEKIVKQWENTYIWRIRLPFEEYDNPRNYITKLINYDKLLIADNSLSNKKELVTACIQTFTKKVPFGIYNVVNSGYITTGNVVERIEKTIRKNKSFNLINEEEFYRTISSLPRSNCIISNNKLKSVGIDMKDVYESIDYCLQNWKD
jgi:dTDP-4-dehydrorhamnose reductase